jgi:excisionase family DNA binding protein
MPSNLPTKIGAQLLTVRAAAEMLNVTPRTILAWIEKDAIPFIKLPGGDKPSYRIPLHGLVDSLSGNYDLAADVEEILQSERFGESRNSRPEDRLTPLQVGPSAVSRG